MDGEKIEKLFLEFDEHKTKESIFAYQCDKLECDLQCKLYDEEHCVDLNNQENNNTYKVDEVQELLDDSWPNMWIKYGQKKYKYDNNFLSVSNYALNNSIKNVD